MDSFYSNLAAEAEDDDIDDVRFLSFLTASILVFLFKPVVKEACCPKIT